MITLEDALRVAGFGDPSNYPGDWIPMTETMLHKFALAIEAETIAKAVPSDHCVVPRSLVVDVMAYGEDGKVLEPWMVDKLESALLGAFPSSPIEQIAAEPKCDTCDDRRSPAMVRTGLVPKADACPDCATPSSAKPKCSICNDYGDIEDSMGIFVRHCDCDAGTSRACHEVATPGAQK